MRQIYLITLLVASFILNFIIISLCRSTSQAQSDYLTASNENTAGEPEYKLIVLVISGPKNYERRQVIRDTWAIKVKESGSLVLFSLGTAGLLQELTTNITNEHRTHNDIIILPNIEDSYSVLTRKLLLSLDVIHTKYRSTYVMKCDDDTFISSSRLLEMLSQQPTAKLYMGYFSGAARVKKSGQWAEPNFHLCDRYLPYARGGGYILTWDLLQYIINNKDILQVYNSEDVSMGVWLSPLSIERKHDVSFDTEAASRGCQNHHIVSHKQSVDDMRRKQRNLVQSDQLCSEEIILKPEYHYNWLLPPSQCCSN